MDNRSQYIVNSGYFKRERKNRDRHFCGIFREVPYNPRNCYLTRKYVIARNAPNRRRPSAQCHSRDLRGPYRCRHPFRAYRFGYRGVRRYRIPGRLVALWNVPSKNGTKNPSTRNILVDRSGFRHVLGIEYRFARTPTARNGHRNRPPYQPPSGQFFPIMTRDFRGSFDSRNFRGNREKMPVPMVVSDSRTYYVPLSRHSWSALSGRHSGRTGSWLNHRHAFIQGLPPAGTQKIPVRSSSFHSR